MQPEAQGCWEHRSRKEHRESRCACTTTTSSNSTGCDGGGRCGLSFRSVPMEQGQGERRGEQEQPEGQGTPGCPTPSPGPAQPAGGGPSLLCTPQLQSWPGPQPTLGVGRKTKDKRVRQGCVCKCFREEESPTLFHLIKYTHFPSLLSPL